jgi:hypothetical protein
MNASAKLAEAEAAALKTYNEELEAARALRDAMITEAQSEFRERFAAVQVKRDKAIAKARADIVRNTKPVVDIAKVVMVYNGSGTLSTCACGCKGKYSYASAFRKYGSKMRGYEVSDDEVSDRSVKTIVNKIDLACAGLIEGVIEKDIDKDGHYVGVTIGNRVYVAHFAH